MPRLLKGIDFRRLGKQLGKQLRLRHERVVAVRFLPPRAMRVLNRTYRGFDRPTDVLSFAPAAPSSATTYKLQPTTFLGDIALCPSFAVSEARQRKIDPQNELLRLLIHGVLHLSGYDHAKPAEARVMFRLQERCLAEFIAK